MYLKDKPFKMDFHVHSNFSPDSKVSMRDMIEKAINLNITDLAFTDHVDLDADLDSYQMDWDFDRDKSQEFIRNYKTEYMNQIHLYQGLEIGIQPHLAQRNSIIVKSNTYDFIIASLHSVEGQDLYNRKYFEKYTPKEAIQVYYRDLLNSLSQFNDYSVVGHLDLYLRYMPELNKVPVITYYDEIVSVFKKIIENGKGIELNAGGYRYGIGHSNPHEQILKIYKELKGEILTIGSDAHALEYLGSYYNENVALLRKIGFKYLCTFKQNEPIYHKI